MGSLRTLRAESKRHIVFPIEQPAPTLYNFLESWAFTYRNEFIEVVGELYSGHASASYYCFRDSMLKHYQLNVDQSEYYAEMMPVVTALWEESR